MKESGSFLAGTLLSLVNYLMTAWAVRGLVKGAGEGKGSGGFFFVLKYTILLVVMGLIFLKTPVQVGAFVAGFLTVLFVFVLRSLVQKRRED
jgi:membrane protein implicated in regulation of membrane protease activity